jgi:aldehyde dehydrogenase (NAD+)
MGREVGLKCAARFAKASLELGGNNAMIVAPSADLDLALRAIAFSAMGTAGQRCTTLRRLFVHDSIYDTLIPRLKKAYASVSIGDPRNAWVLVACDAAMAPSLIEGLRPLLARFGGMCLISDALSVEH